MEITLPKEGKATVPLRTKQHQVQQHRHSEHPGEEERKDGKELRDHHHRSQTDLPVQELHCLQVQKHRPRYLTKLRLNVRDKDAILEAAVEQ